MGEDLEEAYEEALSKFPGKQFYFRQESWALCGHILSLLFAVGFPMKIRYRKGDPIINIRVEGPEGRGEYEAYLDKEREELWFLKETRRSWVWSTLEVQDHF